MNMTNLKRLIMLNILFSATIGLSIVNAGLTTEADMIQDIDAKSLGEVNAAVFTPYLQRAASSGYITALRLLLAKGVNVNDYHSDYGSALYCAAEAGHTTCVLVLLEHGAHVANGRDRASAKARALVAHCVRELKKRETSDTIDREHKTTGLPHDAADIISDYATE